MRINSSMQPKEVIVKEHLLKDIHITLQAIRDFNAERSGALEAHLIQGHTHQINAHGELLEIRRELRSIRYELDGTNTYLGEIVEMLKHLK